MYESELKKKEPTYRPPVKAFSIYGLVVCGAILVIVGIYLQLNKISILGEGYTRGSYGINGPSIIVLGTLILVFPIYTLIKQHKEKKKFDNNIF